MGAVADDASRWRIRQAAWATAPVVALAAAGCRCCSCWSACCRCWCCASSIRRSPRSWRRARSRRGARATGTSAWPTTGATWTHIRRTCRWRWSPRRTRTSPATTASTSRPSRRRAHNNARGRPQGARRQHDQPADRQEPVPVAAARSWLRKGLEAWYTLLIEALWPKARILEVYANIAEFGDGVYGAQAAARSYFAQGCRPPVAGREPRAWRRCCPARAATAPRARGRTCSGATRCDRAADAPARWASATCEALELSPLPCAPCPATCLTVVVAAFNEARQRCRCCIRASPRCWTRWRSRAWTAGCCTSTTAAATRTWAVLQALARRRSARRAAAAVAQLRQGAGADRGPGPRRCRRGADPRCRRAGPAGTDPAVRRASGARASTTSRHAASSAKAKAGSSAPPRTRSIA